LANYRATGPPGLGATLQPMLYPPQAICNNSADGMTPSSNLYRLADRRARRRIVSFDRRELSRLLNLYSMRVASGEWRDYAIDFRPGMAIFSIFRHTAEQPLFAIAKVPGGQSGGGYMVYNGPRKLAHGDSLEDVLRVFDRKLRLLLGS
jgi:hypothetical protein